MIDDLLEAVRAEASGLRALEAVREIARFHRVQASPGLDRAADWMAARLEEAGFAPEVERVAADGRTRCLGQLMPEGWESTHARATLVDGARRLRLCDESQPLSLVLRSAPARGRFPIVAVPGGDQADHYRGLEVRGAVALVGSAVHPAHRLAVLERGAAGLLVDGRRLLPGARDAFDDPDQVAYTSFWWAGDEPRGWGFVVSPRAGAALRERLAAGARLELEVEIESRRFETTMPLVSALLPGRSGEETLVLAHLCHPRPSANDNASGAAAALEAARVLRALEAGGRLAERERGVRFLWMPELTGTLAWLAADPRRAARTVAALNLDMVGEDQEQCGSTLLIERPPCFAASFAEVLLAAVRARALDWVESYAGPGHVPATRIAEVPYSGGSDHAALVDPAVGVPCPMLIQWPDRFYHSSHDTPDRCDPRSLELAARCAATYAAFLAVGGAGRREALARAVARAARIAALRALEEPDPARAAAREALRGAGSLASLARLGVEPARIAAEAAELERFRAREAPPPALPAVSPPPGAMRPRRVQRGLLDFHRRHWAGAESLPGAERRRFLDFDRSLAGSSLVDLAWFAADGRRSIEEIARLAWLETGRDERAGIEELFAWTARLGLTTTTEETAWSSSAPATDGR